MYLNFYNLKKEPFHITPDPEFLYLSPSHKEALGSIIYGIEQKKGFVVIIGAVGVGKTTILRSYLDSVDKQHLKIIYIFNAKLTFEELVKMIYQELGIEIKTNDIFDMVNNLYRVLIDEYTKGNSVVVVIDEAQNVPLDTLESLRMLSNLETPKDKLLQIVLVGQPEFAERLNIDKLSQLKQRIAIRSTILPLSKTESFSYIEHRLLKSGTHSKAVFTQDALEAICKKACGIPRTINILCDNALITGFGYQQKPVTAKIVREVIRDIEGKGRQSAPRRHFAWGLAAAILVVTVVLTISYGDLTSLKAFCLGVGSGNPRCDRVSHYFLWRFDFTEVLLLTTRFDSTEVLLHEIARQKRLGSKRGAGSAKNNHKAPRGKAGQASGRAAGCAKSISSTKRGSSRKGSV